MSKQNLEIPEQKGKKLSYHQPKVYSLGSARKVEGTYTGDTIDGSSSYYYSP